MNQKGNEQPALWCGHHLACRSTSSDKFGIFLTQTILKGNIVKWNSWQRWWIARLLSQNMAFCKEWRKTSRRSGGALWRGKKREDVLPVFCLFFFLPQSRSWSHVKLSWADTMSLRGLRQAYTNQDEIREFKHSVVPKASWGPEHEDQDALGAQDFKS